MECVSEFSVEQKAFFKEKEQRLLEVEALYRELLSLSQNGILIYQDNTIVFANTTMYRLLSFPEQALVGKSLLELMDVDATTFSQTEHRASGAAFIAADMQSYSGHKINIELSCKPTTFNLEPACLIVVNDLALKRETERLDLLTRSVFDHAGEGFLITDPQNRFVLVNKKFEDITGYSSEEVMGKNPSVLSSGIQPPSFYQDMWKTLHEKGFWSGEVWNRKKDGSIYPELLTVTTVHNSKGELLHYVGVMNDLSVQKANEAAINRLSFYDILTELPNASLFKQMADKAITQSQEQNTEVAIFILDIVRFRNVNDALGHDHGDLLLQSVAQIVRSHVEDEHHVARMSGDNFLLLVDNIKHKNQAADFAEKLVSRFFNPLDIGEHQHVLDIKLGIALSNRNENYAAVDLIKFADEALLEVKNMPHFAYSFHYQELEETASESFYFESALRKAIQNQEFQAYYQPQVCLITQKIIGAEALIRWFHPQMGLVSPDKFIELSEETGLIIPIGRFMIRQACLQWLSWQKKGIKLDRIAVNVSAVQLTHSHFAQQVADIIEETNMVATALELEVTESFLLHNEELGIEMLNRLKQLGVTISMDDFGTGFSSLSYLKKLPLDQLKIDQSFIKALLEDKESMAIVDAIIAVGKAVGLEVIAEGVESNMQLKHLKERQCDMVQGYLFSKPVNGAEFETCYFDFEKNRALGI